MRGPVVVAGAGIGGLTAALALARHGFAVRLFERAERLEEAGAGLQLSPNALRVLAILGLLPALRERAVEAGAVELRSLRTGRRLARVPVRGADGTPYLSVLRSDLQRVLLDAVAAEDSIRVRLGSGASGARQEGGGVVAVLADGSELAAAAMIAADGVHSPVAVALGHAPARASGDVAHRLTMPANGREALHGITAWLAASCHVVAYPVDGGRRLNVVIVSRADAAMRGLPPNRHQPILARVFEHRRDASVWPLLTADRRRLASDPPSLGFIGDAAHAMQPYAAQGAALAIEDGFVAAHALASAPDAATAWRRFEAERRPRWDAVRRRVAFHRFVYHLQLPFSLGRDATLRLRSPEALGRDLGWLYDWRPPSGN